MTNYEKYFSTPEKAAEMQVVSDAYGFRILHFDIGKMYGPELVSFISCPPDDHAALYEWMISNVSRISGGAK